MNTTGALRTIEELCEKNSIVDPRDFMKNGLVHCHKCGTPKEMVLDLITGQKQVFCICECEKNERDRGKHLDCLKEQKMFIDLLVARGIQDEVLRGWCFEKANGGNQSNMEIAKIYVDYFMEDFYPKGSGILMWGNVGTGKTFAAACIANALIKNHTPVLMTSFTKINNDLFHETDKNKYIESLNHFKLLIIDDLGVERKTDYALENLFTVIDERYKSNKPLIVTTNLTLEQMENPEKIEHKRIYDRILERCTPMAFDGVNMRSEKRIINFEEAKQQISFIKNGG